MDASVVLKAIHGMEWAKYRKNIAGIKLNLGIKYHNSENIYPNKATMTRAKESDVRQMIDLVDYTEGVINVFDRGYNNYDYFDQITENNGLFVIRLKENTRLTFKDVGYIYKLRW